jgi:hypothetical protein
MPQPNDRPYDRLIQLKPNFSQSLSEPWQDTNLPRALYHRDQRHLSGNLFGCGMRATPLCLWG